MRFTCCRRRTKKVGWMEAPLSLGMEPTSIASERDVI